MSEPENPVVVDVGSGPPPVPNVIPPELKKKRKKRKAVKILPDLSLKSAQARDVIRSAPKTLEEALVLCMRYGKHMYFSHIMGQALDYMLTPLWMADIVRTLWLRGSSDMRRELESAWDNERRIVLGKAGVSAEAMDSAAPENAVVAAAETHETKSEGQVLDGSQGQVPDSSQGQEGDKGHANPIDSNS